MTNKKGSVNKRRGSVGKVLLATTLAGTAATSAMMQSTTTGAINLKGLFEKSKTFITQKITDHPKLAFSIVTIVGVFFTVYSIYGGGKYLLQKFKNNKNRITLTDDDRVDYQIEEKNNNKNDNEQNNIKSELINTNQTSEVEL